MSKRIRVSSDDNTYYTLPGASGELSVEMANVEDTVFGQEFQSEFPSIGMWDVSGAAYFKGVAGYTAAVKVSGTPVEVVAGAFAQVGATKSYQITDVTKRIISLANTVTIKDDGATVDVANIQSIDYLNGVVTFIASYTPAGAITADYYQVPTAAIGKGRSFSLSQTMSEIDNTDYAAAKANGGWRTYTKGLKQVGLEIGNVWDAANDFIARLESRETVFIDVSPNDTAGVPTTEVLFRGMFKYQSQNQSGNVGALEEETLNLNLYVPSSELLLKPFGWYFGSAVALSPAIRICLDAWQAGTPLYLEYSPDGINGKKGQALVTEASLANSYEGQNEFSFNFKGTGVLENL